MQPARHRIQDADMTEPASPTVSTTRKSIWRRPVLTGAAAVAAVTAAFGAGQILSPAMITAQPIETKAPRAAAALPGFADLVERVSPAVVSLEVTVAPKGGAGDLGNVPPQFRRFFENAPDGPGGPRSRQGGGSGFFISAEGHIVTNNHVVEDATEITATLKDGRELRATVVGRDERTDIAVLKVDGGPFPFVQFAPDARVRVGDWVVAIGNPFGLGGTATAGIVSALGRDIRQETNISDFIQIDAPINPGNSGGPTFDMNGRVIGVNTSIFSRSGGNIGIGFAVPAGLADRTVRQIIAEGRVTYGWLGVTIQDVNREVADSFGLPDAKGALIGNVVPDAPAARAGLRRGDIVVSFDGQRVENAGDLTRRVGQTRVGQTARLEVQAADGTRRTVNVTIARRPSEEELAQNGGAPAEAAPAGMGSLGMSIAPLTPQARARLRLQPDDPGVLVADVTEGSEAEERGIEAGMAILSANGRDVRTAAELEAAATEARRAGRRSISLFVQGPTGGTFVALPLGEGSGAPGKPGN